MRYAEYNTPLWRYWWRRLTRRLRRPQRWPDDGIDYTGWSARALRDVGRVISAGAEGRVTGFQQERQGRFWTVEYPDETNLLTTLPAPGKVELTRPAAD